MKSRSCGVYHMAQHVPQLESPFTEGNIWQPHNYQMQAHEIADAFITTNCLVQFIVKRISVWSTLWYLFISSLFLFKNYLDMRQIKIYFRIHAVEVAFFSKLFFFYIFILLQNVWLKTNFCCLHNYYPFVFVL